MSIAIKGSEVLAEAVELFQLADALHDKIARFTAWAGKELAMETLEDMADILFAIDRAGKTADASNKALGRFFELGKNPWALRWMQRCLNSKTGTAAVFSQLCRAHGGVRPSLVLPNRKREPERYFALMKKMGVPIEMVENEVLQIHWPSAVEYYAKLLQTGEELPEELRPSDAYPRYTMTFSADKDVPLRDVKVELRGSVRKRDLAEFGVQHDSDRKDGEDAKG